MTCETGSNGMNSVLRPALPVSRILVKLHLILEMVDCRAMRLLRISIQHFGGAVGDAVETSYTKGNRRNSPKIPQSATYI